MKYTLAAGFALLVVLAWLFPRQEPGRKAAGEAGGAATSAGVYHSACAACHGEKGEGSREQMAPSIASLPRWYVEAQVGKFRTGLRGSHPDDAAGQRMRAAVTGLTVGQLSEALDTLEAFPAVVHKPTFAGDLKRGAYLYREHCMECHRFNGRGEIAFGSSHVAGLQDWYLIAQWEKFSAGTRGYHPDDEGGAKMRKAAGYLASGRDVRDVIAYIATLAEKYPERRRPGISRPRAAAQDGSPGSSSTR